MYCTRLRIAICLPHARMRNVGMCWERYIPGDNKDKQDEGEGPYTHSKLCFDILKAIQDKQSTTE
jgi:hypothetical protein